MIFLVKNDDFYTMDLVEKREDLPVEVIIIYFFLLSQISFLIWLFISKRKGYHFGSPYLFVKQSNDYLKGEKQ